MLTITVELLHGVLRADPSGLAPTGELSQAEWPPSPHRLFAALVAADGTRDRCRVTTGEELEFLEASPPPTIEASPHGAVEHRRLEPRYVVSQTGGPAKGKAHQEYQARVGAQVRPGVRAAPRSPFVTYRWDVEPSAEVAQGLRVRAARVGYLGTSDSPVAVTVSTGEVPRVEGHEEWVPSADGRSTIAVPRPGTLDALDAHYDRWVADGPAVQRIQSPGLRRLARYRGPGEPVAEVEQPTPTIVWLRFARPIGGRRVTAVAEALKKATLGRYQDVLGEPPAVLHGHVADASRPHELVWFLPLADAGHAHARGRIHGAAMVIPASTPVDLVAEIVGVAQGIGHLYGRGFSTDVRPFAGESRPRALVPERWTTPSTLWATVFPALHERRGVPITLSELGRWCHHAGLPEPISARSGRHPFLSGGVDLVPAEVNRKGKAPRPYSHLELRFAEPVAGPVVVGAGRTRGLGLCAPIRDDR